MLFLFSVQTDVVLNFTIDEDEANPFFFPVLVQEATERVLSAVRPVSRQLLSAFPELSLLLHNILATLHDHNYAVSGISSTGSNTSTDKLPSDILSLPVGSGSP